MLDALDRPTRTNTAVPQVRAERCVHSHVEIARCQACVDACPRDAWRLSDEALFIDTSACDGCGLCCPACPEAAIEFHGVPAPGECDGKAIVFVGCESALPLGPDVLPCVHALGIRDLLRHYRNGMRELVSCTADCDQCPRGAGQRLGDLLDNANAMIASRQLPPIRHRVTNRSEWEQCRQSTPPPTVDFKRSRRHFLKRALAQAGATLADRMAPTSEPGTDDTSPSLLLPDLSPADRLAYVPAIDPQQCDGCDACAKLCPHGAITLVNAPDSEYRIDARRCSGCGICVDVCEQEAVRVRRWSLQDQCRIRLTSDRCHACGTPFHLPAVSPQPPARLCAICRQTNHARNLYQVLD